MSLELSIAESDESIACALLMGSCTCPKLDHPESLIAVDHYYNVVIKLIRNEPSLVAVSCYMWSLKQQTTVNDSGVLPGLLYMWACVFWYSIAG